MKIVSEVSLRDFDFGYTADERAAVLTDEQFDQIEAILEEEVNCGAEMWTESGINDLFRFEEDTIAEWLGFANWEALEYHNEYGDEPCEQDFEEVKAYLDDEIHQQEAIVAKVSDPDYQYHDDLEDEEEELRKLLDIRADEDIIAEMAEKYREELMKGNCKEDAFQEALWYQK